jgi:hypothetical protein
MMRRSTTRGRQGDFLRVCDRSGFTVWASDTVKEWSGLIVCKGFAEPRHPQDYLRARREDMRVPDARPEPAAQFTGPLITELSDDASAGATSVSVVSSARFSATDRIAIMLSSGDAFFAVVSAVPDPTTVEFALDPLPGAASSGAKVINYSAVAT